MFVPPLTCTTCLDEPDDLSLVARTIGRRNLVLHGRRVMNQMQLFFPEMHLPLAELFGQLAPSRQEKLRDSLEYPRYIPERGAQWSRQVAYWMNRSQGDSLRQRARMFRSFALFNTGTTDLSSAVRVAVRSLRVGERTEGKR
jgi:hypothetical protein